MNDFARARLFALLVPSLLMAGALGSQYIGGLHPCEMCQWQRWPHDVAIVLALFSFAVKGAGQQRMLVTLAALAILTSGGIGVFHAGVEYGWWEGITRCTAIAGRGSGDVLADIMNAPLIRCDVAPWSFLGISLAGFNAILSIGAAGLIFALLRRSTRI